MPQYYIKDNANALEPMWSGWWVSLHKEDLKAERDRLNEEYCDSDSKHKRFVIGEMK